MTGSLLTTVEFDAVVGFVDLAGFTAATERFGRVGARGTESLGDLINSLFTPAIEQVHRAGGEVGWFAGDALGVLFDRAVTADANALAALAAVSRTIGALTPVETAIGAVELGVKVGVAAGPVRWNSLQRESTLAWFTGTAVDRAAAAEHHAMPGDLILDLSVVTSAATIEVVESDGGSTRFRRLEPTAAVDTVEPVVARPLAARGDLGHQPPRVQRVARAGDAAVLDQHRAGTSVFFQLDAPTIDATVLERIDQVVGELGGYVANATEGDKGAVLFALFGVPTALADRQRRAALAATIVRAEFPAVACGIASGRLFAGRVGSHARWDYSVLGDRVNTAARLMQAAEPGEILLDTATVSGAGPGLGCGPERDLVLKGKAAVERVVPLIKVADRAGGGAATDVFVGRDAELSAMATALSRPGVTVLVGAAGIGKSRLLERAVRAAGRDEHVRAEVSEADRLSPLRLWRRVLDGLGVTRAENAEPTVGAARAGVVDLVMGRPAVVPLLDGASEEDRAEIIAATLAAVIAGAARPLVIEDLHWADASSLDQLVRLAPRLAEAGVSLVATSRPEAQVDAVRSASAIRAEDLGALTPEAVGELAVARWTEALGAPPRPSLQQDLVDRSAGSPLFCEQLVSLAQARGERADLETLPADVPTTMDDLMFARLDAVPAEADAVVGYASVVSQPFATGDLVEAFGERPGAALIPGAVEILLDRDVIVGFGRHAFAHSLLREIAYGRLSFQVRRELHREALAMLERRGESDMGELARHAAETDDVVRQRRYFEAAAEQAAGQYANQAARTWYQRLLPLLGADDAAPVRLALGRLEFVAGELDAALVLLGDAVRDARGRTRDDAGLALGRVEIARGGSDGFDRIDRVIADAIERKDWALVRDSMEVAADVATMLGDMDRAEAVESLQTSLVDELGPGHVVARPIPFLACLLWMRGDLEAAASRYEQVVDDYASAGDLMYAGLFAADLAGIHYERGDVVSSLAWLDRGADWFEHIGHERAIVRCIRGNEVFIRGDFGDREGARRLGLAAADRALALGDLATVGEILAAVAPVADSLAEADALLDGAARTAARLGIDAMNEEIAYLRARARARAGDFRAAIEAVDAYSTEEHDEERRVDLAQWRLRVGEDPQVIEAELDALEDAGAAPASAFQIADALAVLYPTESRRSRAERLGGAVVAAGAPPALRERLRPYVGRLPEVPAFNPAPDVEEVDVASLLERLTRALPTTTRSG